MSNSPIRVARIITRLNIGGPSIQAIDLSRELASHGFETCLIHGRAAEREGSMIDLLPVGMTQTLYVPELARKVSPVKDARALWKLYLALRRWRPDIVHTHMAKAGALGRLAALAYNLTRSRDRRARLIHTYHGHIFEGYFGAPTTRLFLLIERMLGRRTDALIAISEQIKSDLLRTYRVTTDDRVRLIPLGFNLDRLLAISAGDRKAAREALDIPHTAVVVTTVGRLTAIKEQALFVEMAARLVTCGHDVAFLVVGDGELRADLEAQAHGLGLAGRMRFLGWRGDLEIIYGATDVFVLTSRSEGTPVALIEAMAAGLPAVSTDVGGVRDVITEPVLGVLVPFGDAEALTDAVASLCVAPARRVDVGQRARDSVRRRFHSQRLIEDIRRLYWQLLGNGGTIP